MRTKPTSLALLVIAALGLTFMTTMGVNKAAGDNLDFKAGHDAYNKSLKRPSLWKRTNGLRALATTKTEEAAQLLQKRYQSLQKIDEDPAVKYIVADLAWRGNNCKAAVRVYEKWLKKSDDRSDAWLWFNLQRVIAEQGEEIDNIEKMVMKGRGDEMLRVATLEALARTKHREALIAAGSFLRDDMPSNELERKLMTEACASVIYECREHRESDYFQSAAKALIAQLNNDDQTDTTKLTIARYLRKTLGGDRVELHPGYWYSLLGGERAEGGRAGTSTSFIGVEGTGKRIVFIIDGSTSMLKPLTAAERGSSSSSGGKKDDDGLPWSKINTRFDLAREYLKLAIKGLDNELAFSVVVFDKEARYLKGFDGMHFATEEVKEKAIAAVDRVSPPKDTKKGLTNVYDAYLKAYRVLAPEGKKAKKARKSGTGGGLIKENEHVSEDGLERGADTIFLLSDGAPSWDNYAKRDKADEGDLGGDPEAGTGGIKSEYLIFMGPYGRGNSVIYLVRDIQRMNLIRKAELHAIGIGEANEQLLKMIASVGIGTSKMLGKQ